MNYYRMKKIFCAIFFLQAMVSFAAAQSTPTWKGFLRYNQGKDSSAFELSFQEFMDTTGHSFSSRNTPKEVISTLNIVYNDDSVLVSEMQVIKSPPRIKDFLMMRLEGVIQTIDGQCHYVGSFEAFFNGNQNNKMLGGSFSLQKNIPCIPPKDTTPSAPELPEWQIFDTDYGKAVILQKQRNYRISISDADKIDGERITVSRNDQVMQNNVLLGSDVMTIYTELRTDGYLEVWATGFGAEPPVTLRIQLETDEELLFDERIDLQINQKMRFIVIEKEKP